MKRLKSLVLMSQSEYRAALDGINIFFGAILGVTLAGTEGLATLPYMTLLVMVSGVVVTILYIPASAHRLWYAIALVVILVVFLISHDEGDLVLASFPMPPKLVETLIVWTVATAIVQFTPRRPEQAEAASTSSD